MRIFRIIVLIAVVAGSWVAARPVVASRGEAFWLLFPLWVLIGGPLLRVLPRPRRLVRNRLLRFATIAVLVLFPIGYTAWVARMTGGRIDIIETATGVYFFAVSLEILLLYVFGAFEAIHARMTRHVSGSAPRTALRVANRLVLYALLIPFLFSVLLVHRIKVRPPALDPRADGPFEEVAFASRGPRPIAIRGWFFPRPDAAGTIIACHGVGTNRGDLLLHIDLLRAAGFQVLAFDFRGHGESGGHTVTYGFREREDVLGAWDYVVSRPDVDPERIFGVGFSMGGASLIEALPDLPGLRAAVIDSAFSDLRAMARHQFRFFPDPVAQSLGATTEFLGWLLTGSWAGDVRPVRTIAGIEMPILFFHGGADSMIPPSASEALFAAHRGPKRLRIEPGAGHGQVAIADFLRYREEVKEFFLAALDR
ncbi:MAG: alpha/beta fold hydrolase [Planctomycetes bacterium]|nr:alpha/beta fold hydrolase [Planctomycetota bacterium]